MKPSFIVILLLISCSLLSNGDRRGSPANPIGQYRNYLSAIPLEPDQPPRNDQKVQDYFAFYNVDIPEVAHHFGSTVIRSRRIATHLYFPEKAERTIYLIHGYLFHSASFHYLIRRLVEEGYAVAAFDLPGHGLSSGIPGDIGDFKDYALILKEFIHEMTPYLPRPYGAIGLSMGSAVIIEFCRSFDSPFSRHVLGAPLVRSDKWGLSRFGYTLFGTSMEWVSTWNRDTTSNEEAKKFSREIDPLRVVKIPLTWVGALYRWHDDLHGSADPIPGNFLILQGDKDLVVDWKYNIPFLAEKLKKGDIRIIPGGKHELYLEAEDLREEIFSILLTYLEE